MESNLCSACAEKLDQRLTMRNEDGAAELLLDSPRNDNEAQEQLVAKYRLAVEKLAAYEEEAVAGLLVELPCAVGSQHEQVDSHPGEYTVIVEALGFLITANEDADWIRVEEFRHDFMDP